MEDYNEILRDLNTDCIARSVIKKNNNKDIDKIYNLIQMEYIKHTSHRWFDGDIVLVYPNIRETRSKKHYETVHGVYIGENTLYVNYHALLVNISNGSKYVLKKPLKFELGDNLPMCIDDLEGLEKTADIDIPIRRVDKILKLTR